MMVLNKVGVRVNTSVIQWYEQSFIGMATSDILVFSHTHGRSHLSPTR